MQCFNFSDRLSGRMLDNKFLSFLHQGEQSLFYISCNKQLQDRFDTCYIHLKLDATLTLLPLSLCMVWPTLIQLSSTTRVTKQEILHRVRFIFITIPWLCSRSLRSTQQCRLVSFHCWQEALTQFSRAAESLRPHTLSPLSAGMCSTDC